MRVLVTGGSGFTGGTGFAIDGTPIPSILPNQTVNAHGTPLGVGFGELPFGYQSVAAGTFGFP